MKRDAAWAERELSAWLASPLEFGEPPVECEVCYRKPIPTAEGTLPCFLVRYKMKSGAESVGFVGPTPWSFVDLPLAEIEKIPERMRMRRMLNLYIGWWLAFTAAQGGARAPLTEEQTAAAVKDYVERENSMYSVRDPKFVEGATIDGVYYAVVRATRVFKDGKGGGDEVFLAATVSPRSKKITAMELIRADAPVFGKLPLYHHIGTLIGPFQIVRWGRPSY